MPRARLASLVEVARTNSIYVIAGVNGAGKSSVLSAPFTAPGTHVFNPDAAAQLLIAANPGLEVSEANSLAWHQGKRLLDTAIAERLNFAFETTLGGASITAVLLEAASLGQEVRMLYVGLDGVELHLQRVAARVAAGGHDIPKETIRRRYDSSRENLLRLLPRLTEFRLFDNTRDADPTADVAPEPVEILRMNRGKIIERIELDQVPQWAKPIVAAAFAL